MKKKIFLMLMVVTMLSATACKGKGTDANTSASKSKNTTEVTSNEVVSDGKDNTNTNKESDTNNETNINEIEDTSSQLSKRVVASSVAVVEILDALNVAMVGVPTSSYELPESVKDATRIGNPMSPDMEIISSLSPSVVVSVDSLSADLKAQFENLKIPSEFMNLSSYTGLKDSIIKMGERFNKLLDANKLIANLEEKEAEVTKRIEGKTKKSVLIIFGASGNFMAATENTYIGDLVKHAGGENILAGSEGGFLPIDMEYLADKNPEYILFMAHANPEESLEAFKKEFEINKAWQNFDAVVNNNTIALETGYFGMSANLLAGDAMIKLVDMLYAD